jgi:hypothetical protein
MEVIKYVHSVQSGNVPKGSNASSASTCKGASQQLMGRQDVYESANLPNILATN